MSISAPEYFLSTSKIFLEEKGLRSELRSELQSILPALGKEADRIRQILARMDELDKMKQHYSDQVEIPKYKRKKL